MVRAAQATIRGVGSVLMDVVTVVEVVVIFMLDTYRSLLMCTIELAVRGTLELMIGAVKGVSTAQRLLMIRLISIDHGWDYYQSQRCQDEYPE